MLLLNSWSKRRKTARNGWPGWIGQRQKVWTKKLFTCVLAWSQTSLHRKKSYFFERVNKRAVAPLKALKFFIRVFHFFFHYHLKTLLMVPILISRWHLLRCGSWNPDLWLDSTMHWQSYRCFYSSSYIMLEFNLPPDYAATGTVGFLTNFVLYWQHLAFPLQYNCSNRYGNKFTEVLILLVVIVSDVNVSSNWRGYLAIWFSESSRADNGMPGLANCKALPKVRNYRSLHEIHSVILLSWLPRYPALKSSSRRYAFPAVVRSYHRLSRNLLPFRTIFRFLFLLRVRNTD